MRTEDRQAFTAAELNRHLERTGYPAHIRRRAVSRTRSAIAIGESGFRAFQVGAKHAAALKAQHHRPAEPCAPRSAGA